MAEQLVATLEEPWRPEVYRDAYRDTVLDMIRQKAENGEIEEVEAPAEAPSAEVVDIMALLKRSIETRGPETAEAAEADGDRGGDAGPRRGRRKKVA